MIKLLKGFFIDLQFFTAIPVPLVLPMDKLHLKKAVQAFPLLGIFQGIIYASLTYVLIDLTPFSNLAAAFLIWLITILFTGGIHLDGWIDASDAYFSYKDQSKRLEIMKDPRTGAFGVISVIVLLSCRFLFIYEIIINVQFLSYMIIMAIPFLSKSVMGVLLLTVKPAKQEGLGVLFQSAATWKDLWLYPVYIISFVVVIGLYSGNFLLVTLFILASVILVLFLRMKAIKWFGGITGDVLGASVEGTDLFLWMILWLLHYFVMG
nr:adenosylcobinamide-GDP ribazoletransferase [Neobacillus sp. Marseille-Q6967]